MTPTRPYPTGWGGSPSRGRVALERPRRVLAAVLYGLLREGSRAEEAASALAELDAGQGVPILLREAANDRSPALRALAVAARRWREELSPAVRNEALTRLRLHPDDARGWLLRAVARDRSVEGRLRRALQADDPVERAIGAFGLELIGSADAAPWLVDALATESDPEAFRRMASSATTLGARVAPGSLWARMEDPRVAAEAMLLAAALAEDFDLRRRRRLGETLRRNLRADDARTRAGAARALAVAGDRDAWRALLRRVETDVATEVRRAAARALNVLAPESARDALEAVGRVEEDGAIRRALREATRTRRRAEAFELRGRHVLRVRVVAAEGETEGGIPVEVVLPDGRWLRLRSLPSGEVFLADLPSGDADVRVEL